MIQHKLLRLFSACVAAVLVCCTVCRVAALPPKVWQEQYSETKLHLQTLTPQIGSVGGEWLVLGLARSGAFDGENPFRKFHFGGHRDYTEVFRNGSRTGAEERRRGGKNKLSCHWLLQFVQK